MAFNWKRACWLGMVVGSGLWARESGGPPPAGEPRVAGPVPPPYYVSQTLHAFAPADLSDQPGRLREWGSETAIGWQSFRGPEQFTLWEAGYRRLSYDLGAAGGLADDTSAVDLVYGRASVKRPWEGDWNWTGAVAGSLGAFEGADLWQGANALLTGGVGYKWRPGLELSANLLVFFRPDEDVLVLPVPAVLWQVTPRWRIRTANGVFSNYLLTEDRAWELAFSAVYESRGFAVDGLRGDRAPVRAIEERYIEWRAGVIARLSPRLSLEGRIIAKTMREFKYLRRGNTLDRIEADAGFGGSLGLQWRF